MRALCIALVSHGPRWNRIALVWNCLQLCRYCIIASLVLRESLTEQITCLEYMPGMQGLHYQSLFRHGKALKFVLLAWITLLHRL